MQATLPPSSTPVLTLDGPSGSGKGTVAQKVAHALGWHFLDSGALYRLVALSAQNRGVEWSDELTLEALTRTMDVRFVANESGGEPKVMLEGQDVTRAIRTDEMGRGASQVAALPAVRKGLLQRQREFLEAPGLVADGRDMGTVVFPNAPLKIYLTASAEERARRRYLQLQEKGFGANLGDLLISIQARDEQDMNRPVAPLKPAEDAILLDSTQASIDEIFQRVMSEARARGLS
ncbi:Cytidylate kinase [gamma proteobacterium HdN1]|nr:Cytidylate kinase [gamma proteobacterium HdN1]